MTPRRLCAVFQRHITHWGGVRRPGGHPGVGIGLSDAGFVLLTVISPKRADKILDRRRRP
jgi:hypothetical protein